MFPKEMDIKKGTYYNKNKFWAGILLAQFFLFFLFSKSRLIVSSFIYFFNVQKKYHQLFFSWIPFSIGDIFYSLLIIQILYSILCLFRKKKRKKTLRKILILLNLFYLTYKIFWGMLYFKTSIIERIPEKNLEKDKAKILCIKYLKLCKETRKTVKENKNGVFIITNIEKIKLDIISLQKHLPKNIINAPTTEIISIKPSIYSKIMGYTGILGYYNPFTAEAQYNATLPSIYLPFTLAHESAHQLGIAREQEANFTAYLIGKNAKNPELKYSTQYFVLKSLINYLEETDKNFTRNIINNFSASMNRDAAYNKSYIKQHEGFIDIFFGDLNNIFLKSNQQEGSITYNYFTDILIKYEDL